MGEGYDDDASFVDAVAATTSHSNGASANGTKVISLRRFVSC